MSEGGSILWVHLIHIRLDLRPTSINFPQCSTTRETSLSLQPVDRKLLVPVHRRNLIQPEPLVLCRIAYLQVSPSIQKQFYSIIHCRIFNKLSSKQYWATPTSDFCYSLISQASIPSVLLVRLQSSKLPPVLTGTSRYLLWVIPSPRASIATPRSSVSFETLTLSTVHYPWRFPPMD